MGMRLAHELPRRMRICLSKTDLSSQLTIPDGVSHLDSDMVESNLVESEMFSSCSCS